MLRAYVLEVIALFPCSPRRVLSLGIVIISAQFALHSVSLLLLLFLKHSSTAAYQSLSI